MSLWFVAFQGSTPIGGPLIGAVIAATDARVGLAVGGVACLVVAVGGRVACRRLDGVEEIKVPDDAKPVAASGVASGSDTAAARPAAGNAADRTGEFVAVAAER
jgi:hypothetical protein